MKMYSVDENGWCYFIFYAEETYQNIKKFVNYIIFSYYNILLFLTATFQCCLQVYITSASIYFFIIISKCSYSRTCLSYRRSDICFRTSVSRHAYGSHIGRHFSISQCNYRPSKRTFGSFAQPVHRSSNTCRSLPHCSRGSHSVPLQGPQDVS